MITGPGLAVDQDDFLWSGPEVGQGTDVCYLLVRFVGMCAFG